MTRCSTPGNPRILIADDSEATRYMFRLLTEVECEVLTEVENGMKQ